MRSNNSYEDEDQDQEHDGCDHVDEKEGRQAVDNDHLSLFNRSVDAIANAAKKFKAVAGGDDDPPSYVPGSEDGNPYAPKIPVSAFCLRLAHQIWRDTRSVVDEANNDGDECPMHPMMGGMRMVAPPQVITPEQVVMDIAGSLTPEQRGEMVAMIQQIDQKESPSEQASQAPPAE